MDCDGLGREEFLHIVAILPELFISVGEQERSCFDDEVECSGPLATRFNFGRGFWPSKLDLSRSNTSDAFVNAVDVVERREDGVDVDSLSFDKCVPFSVWKSCWSA